MGRHSQLVEAVQSREGPIGVLYCARDVVMVQLPVENGRKKRDKRDGRREGRRRAGTESARAEAFHSPGRGWSGSHGLPPLSITLPPLHLAFSWPSALPTKRILSLEGWRRSVHVSVCVCVCVCVLVCREKLQHRETHV